ncbi:hypothetical protein A6U86_05690 [Rhizobium sp. AC27/96]|uniref:hypothetical protein n=1 Tax=Rhizobium sp. AC27/96 TaxID=1841653 RepID=UPI0008279122|nr:hypothetical protein [Rhizobium sp. AC27/96]OCJ12515.1 hypothetical protein A6U86_05690 [Rhizobium sp. AC27/96]
MTYNQAAETTVDDHLRSMLSLMKRGARVSLTDIPNDPTFLSSHIGGGTAQAISEKIERLLAVSASPSDAERHERAVPEPIGYASDYGLEKLASKAHWYCLSVSKAKEKEYVHPIYAAPPPPAAVQEPVAVKVILDQVAEMLRVYELDHAHVLNDELANLMAIARQFRSALSPSQSDPAPEIAALREENERLRMALGDAEQEFNTISCEGVTETRSVSDALDRAKFFADRGAISARAALSEAQEGRK